MRACYAELEVCMGLNSVQKYRLAYTLVMSTLMSGLMSLVVTIMNLGFDLGFGWPWIRAWITSVMIALPAMTVLTPLVARVLKRWRPKEWV